MVVKNRPCIIFCVLLILFSYFSIAQENCEDTRNNGRLDPGEYCDPGTTAEGDEIFFDDIRSCFDIPLPDSPYTFGGELGCKENCQLDISECGEESFRGGNNLCPTCESCDDIDIPCDVNLCINFCGGGSGACHYVGDFIGREDCVSCVDVDSCDDYDVASCGSNGNDACNLAARENWNGYFCEWSEGQCKTNRDCRWDCEGIYGPCEGDGFKYKSKGSIAECILITAETTSEEDCLSTNPYVNFPDKVACGLHEKNFPIFTWFNIIISLLLLFLYYLKRNFDT